MTPEMLERDLSRLATVCRFHNIQMVGGEPTIHKGLVKLMEISRASGIAVNVLVITNGRLLPRMGDDFWQTLDALSLSKYPTLDESVVELAKSKCAQYNKPLYVTNFTEFHKQFRSTPSDGSNFHTCHWKSDCYTVHNGYFGLCPQSVFFPSQFMGLNEFVDCLPLEGITDKSFAAFLNRTEPFNACRICIANECKPYPWKESETKEQWLAESTL